MARALRMEQLSEVFRRLAEEHLPEMQTELHRRLHEEMREDVIARSPVGTRTRRYPSGKTYPPGTYKRSHVSSVGPQPSAQDDPGALHRLKATDTSWLGTRGGIGNILEGGRRRGRGSRGTAKRREYMRMLGSTQAPRGIYRPARRRLGQRARGIAEEIIRQTDRRVEGGF